MEPPFTSPPPTVSENVRKRLLALASQGVTTVDAATQLGLTVREVWRHLGPMRDAGDIHLARATDGPGVEWRTNQNHRSA
ncbi:hypothetical protein ABZW49_10095 [Nonomuraea wenchangensis]